MTETWEQVRQQEKQLDAEVSVLMRLWKGLLPSDSCPSSNQLLKWRREFSYKVMTQAMNLAQDWCRTHRDLTPQQIARTAYVHMLNRTNEERTRCQKTTKT